jgi:CheY-like chemotaxis protein
MILFIDDEPRIIDSYVVEVSLRGFETRVVSSANELSTFLETHIDKPQCIVLDVMFPGERILTSGLTSDGLTAGMPIFASLRSYFPDVPVVVFTNASSPAVKRFFLSQNNCSFYYKTDLLPYELADIVAAAAQDLGNILLNELKSCPRGLKYAKQFESVCVRILEYLFVPPFQKVIPQSRRADGHDIRDAILPNRAGGYFWESLLREFDAKHIVVEFKNYTAPIGKSEVSQLREYLTRKSLGRFGLIISRLNPSKSALISRSDAYEQQNCLILFLNDNDLQEMIEIRRNGQEPVKVLEQMKEEFELKY